MLLTFDEFYSIIKSEHVDQPKAKSVPREIERRIFMKIMLDGEEIEVTKIKQSEFYDVLKDKVNILLFGKSGWGKSQIVKRYCNDNGLKLKTISLASKLPESIGGIPHATDKGYYE